MPKWLIILLVVLIVILLGCCGGFVTCTYFVRKAGKAGVEGLGALVTEAARRQGVEYDTTGAGLALPASFPADVPAYAGFKAKQIFAPPEETKGVVTFTGTATPEQVGDFYKKALTAKGWTQEYAQATDDGVTQGYRKGDEQVFIAAAGTGADCTITVTYDKKATSAGNGPGDATPPPAEPPAAPAQATPAAPADDTPAPPAGIGGAVRLPPNFPKDIPVIDGATVTMAQRAPRGGMIYLESRKSVEDVLNYYERELAKQGWKQENQTAFATGGSATYTKDNIRAVIAPTFEEGKSTTMLRYEQQE
jgi:hypothetical protein